MFKILCATDQTDVSRKAEKYAAELAKNTGSELCYVHVSPPKKNAADPTTIWLAEILEEAAIRDHKVLNQAVSAAQNMGVKNVSCVTIRGPKVVSAIIEYAEKEGFNQIVVGSTGREGIPRFVLGSDAGGIIHKAHCPVTVVR